MQHKIRNLFVSALFVAILASGFLFTVLHEPNAVSAYERRKLAQPPVLAVKTLVNGKFSAALDAYAPDQFVLRDSFRALASATRLYLFRQQDTNDVYLADSGVYKLEYPYKPASVEKALEKIRAIFAQLPDGARAFYAVIPDKNYYTAAQNGYPALDYDALFQQVHNGLDGITGIDLTNVLSAGDYYYTDTHWRQERLSAVYDKLAASMELTLRFSDTDWTEQTALNSFYGVLYGQLALPVKPDSLVFLSSEATEHATVYNLEKQDYESVYTTKNASNMDPYDVFLSGAASFLVIENPDAASDRELVLFRDSFGSSIAPLFIPEYKKITLVDLRYITSAILPQYLTFSGNQDVLFLYSTLILNSGEILR